MFLIGVFIFKSNDSSSERKSENKIVKQTLPQNPFIDEPEGEKTNEVIQKNEALSHISEIKNDVIAWTKNIFTPKNKAIDISETNKELISQYKNEITKGNDGNEKTKIVQQDKNGNITENKYEQTFPNKNNDSDLLTGKAKYYSKQTRELRVVEISFLFLHFFHQHK